MRTKLVAMVLLLFLVVEPFAQVAYAGRANHGDEDGNNDDVNDKVYEEIKVAAEARRDELLYLVELDLPTDIMEKLEKALYAMEEAEEMVDTREATENYLYALKRFRNTWQKYLNNKPEAAEESFEEADGSDKPSPEETEPPEDLEEEIRVIKEKRLVKIQEKVKEKINTVSEHINELKDYLSEEDSEVVKKAIENEEKKLEKIMDKVSKGDYDDAIDTLIETEFEIDDYLDKMKDKEAAKTLKTVEKLQIQFLKISEQKQKKSEEGEDTSTENVTIEMLGKELDKIKQEFKENAKNLIRPDKDKKNEKKEKEETEEEEDEQTDDDDEDEDNDGEDEIEEQEIEELEEKEEIEDKEDKEDKEDN